MRRHRHLLPPLPVAATLAAATLLAAMWPLGPASLAQDAPAASTFAQQRARFEGTWRLATTPAQARQTVDRAIDQAVGAMNFFVRSVARGQLRDNTPINRSVLLEFRDPNRIRVRFDTGWEATTALGRTGNSRSLDGDAMRVTQRFRGENLEQVFETDQGTRWNTYTITGENELRLDATTQGMMMPQPMRFSLTYRRR